MRAAPINTGACVALKFAVDKRAQRFREVVLIYKCVERLQDRFDFAAALFSLMMGEIEMMDEGVLSRGDYVMNFFVGL